MSFLNFCGLRWQEEAKVVELMNKDGVQSTENKEKSSLSLSLLCNITFLTNLCYTSSINRQCSAQVPQVHSPDSSEETALCRNFKMLFSEVFLPASFCDERFVASCIIACYNQPKRIKRKYREPARRTGCRSRAEPSQDCSGTLFCDCKPWT